MPLWCNSNRGTTICLCGVRMHVFVLLCITRVYAKPEWTPKKHAKCVGKICVLMKTKMHECNLCKLKCTSAVCENQRCTCAVRANHDAHSGRLTCIFMSLIFYAHAGYFANIFRNVSSHVVASHMCSQV